MAARHIPGAAIAVIQNGQVVKRAAYGEASLEHHVPVTPQTIFSLASTTKVFTALTIMSLVEDGKLTIDQPVRAILPELPAAWSAVTVRHCLSHTSGLPDAISDDVNVTPIAADRSGLLKKLAAAQAGRPGEDVAYNQAGYVLLGMIIERLTGQPYEAAVKDRVITKAGMKTARFGDAWDIIEGRADLYTTLAVTPDHSKLLVAAGRPILSGGIRRYGSKVFPDYLAPAIALNASLEDLLAFEAALASGRIVRLQSLATMTQPYRLPGGADGPFGLAFNIETVRGRGTVSYGGGAAVWRVAAPEGLTAIVLTNLQGSSPETLADGILGLYQK